MANKIGIVTGILLEDKLLRKGFKHAGYRDVLTACAAGTINGAKDAAHQLIGQGATHLISFGVCGGLAPDLKAGDLILAHSVRMNEDILTLQSPWLQSMYAQNPHAKSELMLSVETPIASAAAKQTAFKTTSAVAVDVESYAVVKIAKTHNLPSMIIRAVLDASTQSLPKAALSGVDEAGQTQIWPVITSLAKHPQDLPALINLGRDSARAQKTLKQLIKKGAPNFWAP